MGAFMPPPHESTGSQRLTLETFYAVFQAKPHAFQRLHLFLPAGGTAIVDEAVEMPVAFPQTLKVIHIVFHIAFSILGWRNYGSSAFHRPIERYIEI